MKPELLDVAAAGEVLTLQRAAFATEVRFRFPDYTDPITQTLANLHEEFQDQGALALGIRDQGRLIAAMRMRPEPDDPNVIFFYRLSVAPDRTGEGLGRTLMEAAVNGVQNYFPEAKKIRFNAAGNFEWLIAWYGRLGFEVVQKGMHGIGNNWLLERSLTK